MRCLIAAAVFGCITFLAQQTTAQSASVERNLKYNDAGQRLDLCRPNQSVRKTALVFIHGGGFKTGNRGQMRGYCKLLAQGGFTSVTIDYRKTKQGHSFPAPNQDVGAAVQWLQGRAGQLGIDPNRIVLIGYSAGATLALRVGLDDQVGAAGIVAVAPVTDFAGALTRASRPLQRDLLAYIGSSSPRDVSPLGQVNRGDPPVFLFHGKQDRLVPISHSTQMAETLKRQNVKTLFRVFEDAGHEIMLPNKHLKQLLHDMTGFLVAIDQAR